MRKFALASMAVMLPALAQGQPAPAAPATQDMAPATQQVLSLDPMHLCYDEGVPYSEGARHGDLICSLPVPAAGAQQGALIWRPVRPQGTDTTLPPSSPLSGLPSR